MGSSAGSAGSASSGSDAPLFSASGAGGRASGGAAGAAGGTTGAIDPTSRLTGLPSAPGAHIDAIRALSDDTWLKLDGPAADPEWGRACGRSWGGRALILAPDVRGAFFMGEGPHAHIKSNGHALDDLWLYDINGNRWITLHPGTNPQTFNQRVKDNDLHIDEHGELADMDGQKLPLHTLIHAWDLLSYDTDARQLAFLGAGFFSGDYYLAGAEQMAEGLAILHAQKATENAPPLSPWSYDVVKGRFDRYPLDPASPVYSVAFSAVGGYPYFQYLPKRKQFFLGGEEGVAFFDPATKAWVVTKDQGDRPPGYDHGGCYDSKRERIYMGAGAKQASGGFYSYDIASATWTKPQSKGTAPQSFRTNEASAFYDSANDVVTIFNYEERKTYTYDPNADAWTDRPFPTEVADTVGYGQFSAFYDPELNAYFAYAAPDGGDEGSMWVYRYRAK